ncbi:DUF4177 domain-containing protein [Rhodococcus erythropolis]|jgi:predicted YcjX-like family ATPase|uniref:DUF4177 domain-containing protein n=1 Tax=Rhodococcus erythropolis TaxID=1833 RepID=A0A8I0ZX48_RHOER|nr:MULTISPECIES: DUF4177 domain-containing protein [Rhodococcus]MBH5143874.1 DUF4177 domain-containing protein [Rhodococcus erythropolis]MBY6386518.1 DUF4177 domain-containing protein [Rhodococcus erythropolis]MDV6211945.1 DUF4177 domain-containing protein [Rhodococcus erythropolis]PBI95385.1 hypothetical protein BKP42_44920 [Rhodococcus erythropolis]
MDKWQYWTESINITERWNAKKQAEAIAKFNEYLNHLGSQGWELISYQEVLMTGNLTGNIKGRNYMAIFKRRTS